MAHQYAGRLALIAFATAAVQGLMAGTAFEPALKNALVAAVAFYALGWLCGELARRIVAESVEAEARKAAIPVPLPAAARTAGPQPPVR